jgi:membrane protease subunit HflC
MPISMNRLIALGVTALVVLYLLFSSLYVVNVREQAIVMRFGKITQVNTQPGIYFKIPTNFVDTVLIIENRLLRYNIANMRLQVKGGATYIVDAFLAYRISDPTKFRERAQGNLDLAEQRIATRFEAALRQVYGLREFNAALSVQRPQMMKEARDLIKPDMDELGIDVTDVRILRTDLTPEVSAQTFERMKAERQAQAAALRAKGQEAQQSIQAIADRQAVEIVAAANKDSEILRGQGDAQRNAIFAKAYGADPEFFQFYRSLQSYRTAMAAQSGTTMVLTPNSEFFKFFNGATTDGKVPPPASPQGIPTLPSTQLTVAEPPDVLPQTNVGDTTTTTTDQIQGITTTPDTSSSAASSAEPSPIPSSVEPVLPSIASVPEAVSSIEIPAPSSAPAQ